MDNIIMIRMVSGLVAAVIFAVLIQRTRKKAPR